MRRFALLLAVILIGRQALVGTITISTTSLSQAQLNNDDMTYVFSQVCDLGGAVIYVPSGSNLRFKKGACIVNGTLVGNGTSLSGNLKNKIGCNLDGSWVVSQVSDLYFNSSYLDDTQILTNLSNILLPEIHNSVRIKRSKYVVSITSKRRTVLTLPSNTTCVSKADIILKGNSYVSYSIIDISNASDVSYRGGKLTGDVGTHTYVDNSTSEWGHGINIINSKNVTISDVEIRRCIGDGVYIGGGSEQCSGQFENASKNIFINKIYCHENRRQGLSAVSVNGLKINQSKFTNTGIIETTNPSAGIDIEPNKNQSVWNVSISGCTFNGNVGKQLLSTYYDIQNDVSNIYNIDISDCNVVGEVDLSGAKIKLSDTYMNSLAVRGSYMPEGGMSFYNCDIDGGGIVLKYLSLVDDSTKEPHYSFTGCRVNYNSNMAPKDSKGIITTIGYYKSLGNVIFNSCEVAINENSPHKDLVGSTNNQKIIFEKCDLGNSGSYDCKNAIIIK